MAVTEVCMHHCHQHKSALVLCKWSLHCGVLHWPCPSKVSKSQTLTISRKSCLVYCVTFGLRNRKKKSGGGVGRFVAAPSQNPYSKISAFLRNSIVQSICEYICVCICMCVCVCVYVFIAFIWFILYHIHRSNILLLSNPSLFISIC